MTCKGPSCPEVDSRVSGTLHVRNFYWILIDQKQIFKLDHLLQTSQPHCLWVYELKWAECLLFHDNPLKDDRGFPRCPSGGWHARILQPQEKQETLRAGMSWHSTLKHIILEPLCCFSRLFLSDCPIFWSAWCDPLLSLHSSLRNTFSCYLKMAF